MLDRKIAPKTYLTNSINIPQATKISFSNGTDLLVIDEGDVDVCRIDLIFDGGSRYQQNKLEANAAISLLTEGSTKYNSQQISEHFDFYGSFINVNADKDFAKVTAYSINRYFDKTIEMLEEVVKNPSYPENELQVWSKRGKQNLSVELEKTSTLSRIEFFKNIYGENHPYGSFATPNDYDNIQRDNLSRFHSSNIGSSDATIVLSGKISDTHIRTIEKHFGNSSWGSNRSKSILSIEDFGQTTGKHFVQKSSAVQSSIKIGRVLFKRDHPDYTDMVVVNTILGGYFGSRLMKNIREDKGYTYGIGSYLGTLRDSGFIVVSTDVGSEYTLQTLEEIRKEINRLRSELVTENELDTVRSYLMGDILRSFNGPFAVSDNIIGLLNFNQLDYNFFQNLINSVKAISPYRIKELSEKWLSPDSLTECVAGAKNPY